VLRQSLTLGGSLIVAFASVNALVAVSSGSVAGLIASRPRWLLAQRWAMGIMLMALGTKMAIDAWHWAMPM
jgi:threonine/homoserine/homoserine lactone efflux protein